MSNVLQLNPDLAALHAQIHALRDELARAVAYHDELRHTAIPYLEAVYQQAIGPSQLAALHAQVTAQRTKRLVELALQAMNRGQVAPPLPRIIETVERELDAWRTRIAAMADEVQQATAALSQTLIAACIAEFQAQEASWREAETRWHGKLSAIYPQPVVSGPEPSRN